MRIVVFLILAGAIAVIPASVPAQEVRADRGMAAMQKLSFWEGRWEGEGWMRRGPDAPSRFRSLELVEARLNGRVMLVEGLHHAATNPDELVHHALGVVSFDPESGAYRFRTHLSSGQSGDFGMRLEDGAVVWGMETPRGKIRYTILVQDAEWHEVGHLSPDGETWSQFFQMDLKRVD